MGHDPLDRMRRALRAHIALLVEGDDAIYVNLYELRGISGVERERIVALRDTYEALWEGMLHSAAGAGLVRAGVDLGMVRRLLLGAANWTAQWYAAEGTRTAEQIADAFLATVAFGFIADEPTRNSAVAAALLSAQRSTDTRTDEETC